MTAVTTSVVQSISAPALAMMKPATRINLLAMVERLDGYIDAMAPGKAIDPREGARMQQVLWSTIRDVLRRPADEFNAMFTELLLKFHQHRNGCFSKRYINRFHEYSNLKGADLRTFTRLIELLMATANPASRHLVARQLSVARTMRDYPDQSVVERMEAFYAMI